MHCILSSQVDVIIGEPFFTSGLFPWHNLYFWYAASSAAKMVRPGIKIFPRGATLKAVAGQNFEVKFAYYYSQKRPSVATRLSFLTSLRQVFD